MSRIDVLYIDDELAEEIHWLCHKADCDCDEQYDEWVDNEGMIDDCD